MSTDTSHSLTELLRKELARVLATMGTPKPVTPKTGHLTPIGYTPGTNGLVKGKGK